MTVRIIVDGAAALPEARRRAAGIAVLPMNLIIDGESRPDDGVDLEEVLAATGHEVSTAAPSPGQWDEVIQRERADPAVDGICVITVSAEMSTTYASAHLAASLAEGPIEVVDSRTAAGGEGLVALAAAEAAATGATLAEVTARARYVIERVHLVATLDSLDHLVRSGRVPNLAAQAAHWLHVHPLFEFKDGAAHAGTPAHSPQAADDRMVRRCLSTRPASPPDGPPPRLHAVALHSAAPERAQRLLGAVLDAEPDADAFVGPFGPVMLVHVGPGLAGLAWWWEP